MSAPSPSDPTFPSLPPDPSMTSTWLPADEVESVISDLNKYRLSTRKIPTYGFKLALTALKSALAKISVAIRAEDPEQIYRTTVSFLTLHLSAFQKPSSLNSNNSHPWGHRQNLIVSEAIAQYKKRIHPTSASVPVPIPLLPSGVMLPEISSVAVPQESSLHSFDDLDESDIDYESSDKVSKRCTKFMEDGYLSKALRSLSQAPLATVTVKTVDQLRLLHPCPAPPSIIDPAIDWLETQHIADSAPPIVIDPAHFRFALKKQDNGSAAGPTRLDGRAWNWLVDDDQALLHIIDLAELIVNNSPLISSQLRDLLTASNLIPGTKPNGKIRPIAVGDCLIRACENYMLHMHETRIHESLFPVQLGVGTSCGVESVIHAAQNYIDSNGDSDIILIKLDLQNAYNNLSRRAFLRLVRDQYPELLRIALFLYKEPTKLIIRNDGDIATVIPSSEGVRQGGPLSTVLFCLAIQPALVEISKKFPKAFLKAIADDITIIAPIEEAEQIYLSVSELLNVRLHLTRAIGPKKCACLWPSPRPPPDRFHTLCTELQLEKHVGSIPLLGGVVGSDHNGSMSQIIADLWKQCTDDLSLLASRSLHVQDHLLLLRDSVAKSPSYITRVVPPSLAAIHVSAYQQKLYDHINVHILDNRLSHPSLTTQMLSIKTQLSLPESYGGLGFTLLGNTWPLHYAASLCSSIPLLTSHRTSQFTEIKDMIQYFVSNWSFGDTLHALLPSDTVALWSLYRPYKLHHKLQRSLTHLIHKQSATSWKALPSHSHSDHIRIHFLQQRYASSWLHAMPTSPEYRLSDIELSIALATRLGIPVTNSPSANCPNCGRQVLHDPSHPFTCDRVDGHHFWVNRRHNKIRDMLMKTASEYNLDYIKEPNIYEKNKEGYRENRGDTMIGLNVPSVFDAHVKTVTADSFLLHSNSPNDILNAAALEKRKDHQEKCEKIQAVFIPFVMSHYGTFHIDAYRGIRSLARKCAEVRPWEEYESTRRKVLSETRLKAQFLVLKGNAHIVKHPFDWTGHRWVRWN